MDDKYKNLDLAKQYLTKALSYEEKYNRTNAKLHLSRIYVSKSDFEKSINLLQEDIIFYKDDLNLFRIYGDNCKGVSIKFNRRTITLNIFKNIKKLLISSNVISTTNKLMTNYILYKVIYIDENEDTNNLISEVAMSISNIYSLMNKIKNVDAKEKLVTNTF